MSDKTDEEQREAQKAIGDKLNEAYDNAEGLDKDDLADGAKSKSKQDKDKEPADRLTAETRSEEILDELDLLKDQLSRGEYSQANKRVRRLKKSVKKTFKTGKVDKKDTKGEKILMALDEIRRKKMKDLWMPAPATAATDDDDASFLASDFTPQFEKGKLVAAPGLAETIATRASLDAAFEDTDPELIKFLPISAVSGVSKSDADALAETLGVVQVGDLASHPVLQRLLYLNTIC